MPKKENEEWAGSKWFWICILIEFLLILWLFFHQQLTEFPEQYDWIWDYLWAFFVILLAFGALLYPLGFLLFGSKISSVIIIVLTTFVWIILPIYDEYKDPKRQCYDRTTYDYDWNNDVKCINKYWESKMFTYKQIREVAPKAVEWWWSTDITILDDKYTQEIYRLINEHMFDKNWNCVKPYNIFSKDRDAYYWFELERKLAELELNWKAVETDLDDWPHSLDFRFWVRYEAMAHFSYIWCMDWCWLASDTKEYRNCVFGPLF